MSTYEQKGIIIIYLYISVVVSYYFATDSRADTSLCYMVNSKKDIFEMLQLYFCLEELLRLQNTCILVHRLSLKIGIEFYC